jgi:hypothetical protein
VEKVGREERGWEGVVVGGGRGGGGAGRVGVEGWRLGQQIKSVTYVLELPKKSGLTVNCQILFRIDSVLTITLKPLGIVLAGREGATSSLGTIISCPPDFTNRSQRHRSPARSHGHNPRAPGGTSPSVAPLAAVAAGPTAKDVPGVGRRSK